MREALLPLLLTAAGVLALSGVAKLRNPAPAAGALADLGVPAARIVTLGGAAAELGAAALAVVRPSLGAPAAAILYAFFALVVAAQLRAGAERSCGCLGSADTPPSRTHVLLNLALAGVCAACGVATPATLGTFAHPFAAVVLAAAAAATSWSIVVALELIPQALNSYRKPVA